jgi:hypothetical protein
MPPNTVKVDRSTKWGNPFKCGPGRDRAYAVDLFGKLLAGYVCLCDSPSTDEQIAYREMVVRDRGQLKGKNLACWCPAGHPCHADVLLNLKFS